MPPIVWANEPIAAVAGKRPPAHVKRSLGTSIGAAVIGVVLSHMTTTMTGYSFASEDGFRTGLLIGCGVALVAAAITAVIPAGRAATAGGGAAELVTRPEEASLQA